MRIERIVKNRYSISTTVIVREFNTSFLLTTVYGPTRDRFKPAFLNEIWSQKPLQGVKWLLLGGFNLIYRAMDKNNRNLNLRLMRQFRDTLNLCGLKEIHLQNRKVTWSNHRANPTLVRLDKVFCNLEWDTTFNSHIMQALSSAMSDHCPLLLSSQKDPPRPWHFKFENFWISMPGFKEAVQAAWAEFNPHTEPDHRPNFRLASTERN